MGMIEGGDSPHLACKQFNSFAISHMLYCHHFDGNAAAQGRQLFSLIDITERTGTYPASDATIAQHSIFKKIFTELARYLLFSRLLVIFLFSLSYRIAFLLHNHMRCIMLCCRYSSRRKRSPHVIMRIFRIETAFHILTHPNIFFFYVITSFMLAVSLY